MLTLAAVLRHFIKKKPKKNVSKVNFQQSIVLSELLFDLIAISCDWGFPKGSAGWSMIRKPSYISLQYFSPFLRTYLPYDAILPHSFNWFFLISKTKGMPYIEDQRPPLQGHIFKLDHKSVLAGANFCHILRYLITKSKPHTHGRFLMEEFNID